MIQQTAIAKLTKNMMVVDLMKITGWNRDRALAAVEELERNNMVQFTNSGEMKLQVVGGA